MSEHDRLSDGIDRIPAFKKMSCMPRAQCDVHSHVGKESGCIACMCFETAGVDLK